MTTAVTAKKASVWEDFVDIFISPAEVFARREDGRFGIALLVLAVLVTVLAIGTRSLMQPVFDAEFNRQMALAMKTNPQITPEQMAAGRKFAGLFIYVSGIVIAIQAMLVGIVLWLVSKLFDSKLSVEKALVVSTYSYFPAILSIVVAALIANFMDPASITGRWSVSVGLGRLFDPDATSPVLLAVVGRVDLFIIWVTVLIGVGTYVLGKVTKAQAASVAALVWVIGALPSLYGALRRG